MEKRRANGEGNLRKRKDGWWRNSTQRAVPQRQKRQFTKNVLGRTQAEAKAKLKEAIEMERDINTVKSKKYTVGEWMNEWFENYAKECARPLTRPTGGASTTT